MIHSFFFKPYCSQPAPTKSKECLRIQGLPTLLHDAAKESGIKDSKLMGVVGNGWPVNVVAAILLKIKVSMDWH